MSSSEKKPKTYSFPTTVGAAIDRLYKLRELRKTHQREADKVGEEESALRDHLINTVKKSELNGAVGSLASCSLAPKTVARVTDWTAFYKYIKKHEAWDMLERRPSNAAYALRLEANEAVPGVEPFVVQGLSLHKVSGKKSSKK